MRAILVEGEEMLKAGSAGELLDAAMIGAAQRIGGEELLRDYLRRLLRVVRKQEGVRRSVPPSQGAGEVPAKQGLS